MLTGMFISSAGENWLRVYVVLSKGVMIKPAVADDLFNLLKLSKNEN